MTKYEVSRRLEVAKQDVGDLIALSGWTRRTYLRHMTEEDEVYMSGVGLVVHIRINDAGPQIQCITSRGIVWIHGDDVHRFV